MDERFFGSAAASQITGCSLRQLQYWREKGLIVPTVNLGGPGRSVAYSYADLQLLAVMKYLLSKGLNEWVAWQTIELIKQDRSKFFGHGGRARYRVHLMQVDDGPEAGGRAPEVAIEPLDMDQAHRDLDQGDLPILLWLDMVERQLERNVQQFDRRQARDARSATRKVPRSRETVAVETASGR